MSHDGRSSEDNPTSGSAIGGRDAQFLKPQIRPSAGSLTTSGVESSPLPSQTAVSKWNTDSLSWRVGADVASAASAAATICPIITVIDR